MPKPKPEEAVRREAAARFLREMQADPAKVQVPDLTTYLAGRSPEERDSLMADIAETFTSETGLRVLKLMEKAILIAALPASASESALREHNATKRFVLEIRRIVANV